MELHRSGVVMPGDPGSEPPCPSDSAHRQDQDATRRQTGGSGNPGDRAVGGGGSGLAGAHRQSAGLRCHNALGIRAGKETESSGGEAIRRGLVLTSIDSFFADSKRAGFRRLAMRQVPSATTCHPGSDRTAANRGGDRSLSRKTRLRRHSSTWSTASWRHRHMANDGDATGST